MKNNKSPKKPATHKSKQFKIESLEPRMLMSGTPDNQWKDAVAQLDTQYATHMQSTAGYETDHLQYLQIQGVVDSNGQAAMPTLKDLLAYSDSANTSVASLLQSLGQGISSLIAQDSLSSDLVVSDLNGKTLALGTGATATVTATDRNGSVNLGLALDWITQDSTKLGLADSSSGLSDTLQNLDLHFDLDLQANLTTTGLVIDDNLSQTSVNLDYHEQGKNLHFGLLQVQEVDDTSDNGVADLSLAIHSGATIAESFSADMEFQVSSAARLQGIDTTPQYELNRVAGATDWSGNLQSSLGDLQNASMDDVMGQLGSLAGLRHKP